MLNLSSRGKARTTLKWDELSIFISAVSFIVRVIVYGFMLDAVYVMSIPIVLVLVCGISNKVEWGTTFFSKLIATTFA